MRQFFKFLSDVVLSLIVIAAIGGAAIGLYRLYAPAPVVLVAPVMVSDRCWGIKV